MIFPIWRIFFPFWGMAHIFDTILKLAFDFITDAGKQEKAKVVESLRRRCEE